MSGFWDTAYGWGLKGGAWILVFLAPVQAALITMGVLVLSDLVLGVWAALKSGKTVESAKLRRTPVKLIGYFIGITFALAIEQNLAPDLPAVKTVCGLVAATEGLSVFEKLQVITGIPFFEAIKKLFNKPPEPPPDVPGQN